jgi:hypothetical protein
VFSNPLPSNGHGAEHVENSSCNTFSIVASAYFGRCLEMDLHVTICLDWILAYFKVLLRNSCGGPAENYEKCPYSRSSGRDSNPEPAEYEAGVPALNGYDRLIS